MDEGAEIERLWEALANLKRMLPQGFQLKSVPFEKDDDQNYHMDAIMSMANLRARNYG